MSRDKNTSGPIEEARRVVSTLPFLSFLEEVQGNNAPGRSPDLWLHHLQPAFPAHRAPVASG